MPSDEQKSAALSMQHQIMLFDHIVDIKDKGEQVQVSLSWETPNGGLTPPLTMVLTRNFTKELANALIAATLK
jgi:hypothetical protein